MKTIGKALLLGLFTLSLVALCQGPAALAQSRDLKLISARAGAVNFTSGAVEFKRKSGKAWETLTTKDDLRSGDTVRTGADGRVEVLLNPGSYFRAGGGTEFALVDSSLDDLRLRIARGAAVIEATGYEDSDLSIVVNTPQTRVRIIRTGIYRVGALTGLTELVVEKGRAYVGEDEALLVKGGKVVRIGSGPPEVAKFDKRMRDALDLWSRERGRELAKINDRMNRRDRTTLLASFAYDAAFPSVGGFWYRNPTFGCYTFVPFFAYWRSPYGFGYGSYFPSYYAGCGGCNYHRYPNGYNNGNYSGGNHSGGYNPGYNNGGGNNNSSPGSGGRGGYNPGGGHAAPSPQMPSPAQREINTERIIERNATRSREP